MKQSSKTQKVFYGWWVLASLFITFAVVNVSISSLPLLNAQLKEQFGWTHEQVTRAPSFFFLLVAIFAPIIGILLDKYKAKIIIAVGTAFLILSLLLYATIAALWQLTLVYVFFAIALACAGQISSVFVLAKWFDKYRGIAVGVFFVGSSFGGIIFPQITSLLIRSFNWQIAALGLGGIATLIVFFPLLMLRNKPEEMGLHPDGAGKADSQYKESSEKEFKDISLMQALQSFTFYLLLFITAALCFCIYSLVQHLGYFFKDLKLDTQSSANILSLFFVCSIIGKVTLGYLSDKFSKKSIMLLAGINMCIGPFLLSLSATNPQVFLYPTIVVYGIGYSGTVTVIQLLVSEYYQGKSYGKILAIVNTVDTLAGSAGIYLLGYMRTAYGTYVPAFNLLLGVCLLSTLCVIILKKPEAKN